VISLGVIATAMTDAAHDRQFVHDRRRLRQHFAEQDAGHIRRYRAERSTILIDRLRLRVPSFVMSRPAAHPQQNNAGPFRARANRGSPNGRSGLGGEKLRQAQSTQAQHPGLDEVSSRPTFAIGA
jgi:hypothetical protein